MFLEPGKARWCVGLIRASNSESMSHALLQMLIAFGNIAIRNFCH